MADYLSQSTLQLLIVGLVSIAAVSMGAATITSPLEVGATGVDPGAGAEGIPDEGGGPEAGGAEGNGTVSDEGETTYYDVELERCNEQLASIPGTILYFGGVVGLLGLIKRRYSTGAALIGLYGLSPIVLTVYFLGTACPEADDAGVGAGALTGGSGVGDQLLVGPDVSPVWLLVLLGGLLVAAAAVLVRASGDQTVDIDEEDADREDGADVRDLAAAAGDAADRLEEHEAGVDNAVYRAWWEMTQLLDVPNPDSATPREFAEAAIDLGMDEDDVSELTELFEEVRYGERDPESREDHAVAVFRSIEDEYGVATDVDLNLEADADDESAGGAADGTADTDSETDSSEGDRR